MADISSITSGYEITVQEGFSSTLNGAISSGATTVTLDSTSGYSDGQKVVLTIDRVDSSGTATPNKEQTFYGEISGNSVINVEWTEGSNQSHSDGAVVEDLVTATHHLVNNKWMKTGFNEDGGLDEDAVRDALNLGSSSASGWEVEAETVDSVTNNGNGSYTMTFNSADLSGRLSPGMRLRTTRGTAAPDQCADLEASSSQYFSNSSLTGGIATMTDDITVMAWVKLESYDNSAVISQRTGNNGYDFLMSSNGTFRIHGVLSSGNYKLYQTYQSIPLGRWVHIAGTMNMSTNTGVLYMDGVEVASSSANAGTASSFTPVTTINIGNSYSSNQIDGKLSEVGVFNSVLSEATIREYMTRPLTGSESNCVGAWSLDNDLTDLSSNGNDLTANGGAVATDTDSPFGDRGTSTTLDYGIVTKVDYSTNTDVVVQVPEGCTIDATNAISAVSYSTASSPYGFSRDEGRWEIKTLFRTNTLQSSPSSGTWYGHNIELSVPIGAYTVGYRASNQSRGTSVEGRCTLAESSAAEDDSDMTVYRYDTSSYSIGYVNREKSVDLSSATTFYLNSRINHSGGTTNTGFRGSEATTIIYARCAYL